MANAVELESVTKKFGSKVAVDDLNLAVPDGSIYGFIGPNGSGKTTTLRLMLRIFQPDSGRVAVLGSDGGTMADERVGYLPEERGLYKRMRVIDTIEYFARLKGAFDCRRHAYEWLERLDATGWARQRIETLSKGMAQKVQFIAAVIARPRLVILDEPFAGLDPVNLNILRDAVLSLRDNGATVIFSTHDMNTAEQLCDTILMIYNGRKVLDGSLAEIQSRYPVGKMKVRLANDAELPADLSDVDAVSRSLGFWILNLSEASVPQSILQQLASRSEVEHFEVMRPSLHDIFVEIARPQEPKREVA
jgi:ABC-2 type transport system ATP-binding protein